MDDRLDPRFADALRRALLAEVRTPERAPAPRRRAELVWAGVIAVVAVVAIVGALAFSASQRRADPAAPAVPQPVQPLGGDCAALLSYEQVSDLVGTTVTPVGADDVPVRLAGGLTCTWHATDEAAGDAGVQLVLVPAALRGTRDGARDCFTSSAGAGDQPTCSVESVGASTWIAGAVTLPPGATETAGRAVARRLEAAVEAAGPVESALPARPADAWRSVGCTALGAGLPAALGGLKPAGGPSQTPPSALAAAAWSRTTDCVASSSGILEVHAYPAGAWLEPAVAATRGITTTEEVGVRVYRSAGAAGNGRVVWAFSGSNALTLRAAGIDDGRLDAALRALLRTLDAAR